MHALIKYSAFNVYCFSLLGVFLLLVTNRAHSAKVPLDCVEQVFSSLLGNICLRVQFEQTCWCMAKFAVQVM